MTCYEYGKSMLIVDCGLAFPESDQLGVDFVIPDFTFVERNVEKLKGVIFGINTSEYDKLQIMKSINERKIL